MLYIYKQRFAKFQCLIGQNSLKLKNKKVSTSSKWNHQVALAFEVHKQYVLLNYLSFKD